MIMSEGSSNGLIDAADWLLISNNREFLRNHNVTRHIQQRFFRTKDSVLWTDNFSNLVGLFKD